jgi:hypothetical protein
MPILDLDFGSIGKTPPNGYYRLLISNAELRKNKPPKKGQHIGLTATIIDSPAEGFDDWKVFPDPVVALTQNAMWKTQEFLEAVTQSEWKEDQMQLEFECENDCGEDNCPHTKVFPSLAGETVVAQIQQQEYTDPDSGKVSKTARIVTWLPDDGSQKLGSSDEDDFEYDPENSDDPKQLAFGSE